MSEEKIPTDLPGLLLLVIHNPLYLAILSCTLLMFTFLLWYLSRKEQRTSATKNSDRTTNKDILSVEDAESALSEYDVYIAYGRTDQADDIMSRIIDASMRNPDVRIALNKYLDKSDSSEQCITNTFNKLKTLSDSDQKVVADLIDSLSCKSPT